MRAKLVTTANGRRILHIYRGSKFDSQFCPFENEAIECGDHCPAFEEYDTVNHKKAVMLNCFPGTPSFMLEEDDD